MRIVGWGLACVALLLLCAPAAQAKKRASAAQSAAMWKVVDPEKRCRHARGWISTAARDLYGTVVIADANCGNGQAVLRRKGGRWTVRGQGSDWGFLDRCDADLRRIPAAVLRDLLGKSICRRYSERACGSIPAVTEGVEASERVFGAGVPCAQARSIVQASNELGTRPDGWDCLGSGEGVSLRREPWARDITTLARATGSCVLLLPPRARRPDGRRRHKSRTSPQRDRARQRGGLRPHLRPRPRASAARSRAGWRAAGSRAPRATRRTPRPLGYRCRYAGTNGFSCRKGSRTVRWSSVPR